VKYDVVARLTDEFKREYGAENVVDINGARVSMGDGWGLVRASSNLPALVIVIEAKTAEGVQLIKDIFKEKFVRYPEIGDEEEAVRWWN
jgi:phosphomannomutase